MPIINYKERGYLPRSVLVFKRPGLSPGHLGEDPARVNIITKDV